MAEHDQDDITQALKQAGQDGPATESPGAELTAGQSLVLKLSHYPMPLSANPIVWLHWMVTNILWLISDALCKTFATAREHPWIASISGVSAVVFGATNWCGFTCPYFGSTILAGFVCWAVYSRRDEDPEEQ